ncbi:MAG: outer membrane protein assembly factor BamC [Acidiferrobacterales bacterium]
MKILKIIFVILMMATLAACSSSSGSRKVDYQSARSSSDLEVPPDLSSLTPSQQESDANTYTGYTAEQIIKGPAGTAVLPTFAKVSLNRAGRQRWLVVNADAAKTWSQVREFVFGMGLAIARENKATGVIETDWAENRAGLSAGGMISRMLKSFRDTGLRDKYRIRIEEGKVRGTTDVYLTHQGMEEVVSSGGGVEITQTIWQRRPSDAELEAELLRLLMIHLGVEDVKARSLLTAGSGRTRATLVFDDNDIAELILVDDFGSAWRRVGKALDKMDAKIENKNRGTGIFTVAIKDIETSKKKPGFISRMFGGKKKQARTYRLRVSAAGKGSELALLNVKKDQSIDSPDGKRFMKSLFEELR